MLWYYFNCYVNCVWYWHVTWHFVVIKWPVLWFAPHRGHKLSFRFMMDIYWTLACRRAWVYLYEVFLIGFDTPCANQLLIELFTIFSRKHSSMKIFLIKCNNIGKTGIDHLTYDMWHVFLVSPFHRTPAINWCK